MHISAFFLQNVQTSLSFFPRHVFLICLDFATMGERSSAVVISLQ
jgi:hypothetical protein